MDDIDPTSREAKIPRIHVCDALGHRVETVDEQARRDGIDQLHHPQLPPAQVRI